MYFRNGINHIIYIICAVSEPVPYQVEKGRRTSVLSFLSFPSILEKTLPPLLNFKMYCKVECTRRIGSMRIEKCSLTSNCITTSELGWVFKLRVPKEKEGEGFERDDAGIYILLVKKNSFSRNWSLSLFPSSLVFDARRWGLSSRLLVFLSSYERLSSITLFWLLKTISLSAIVVADQGGKRHALVDYICCSCDYCVGGCDSC